VRGDDRLAVQLTECADCFDDYALGLWHSARGAPWAETTFAGLDTLDEPNTDVAPIVVGTESAFVAFAESSDARPLVFVSRDGRQWEEARLDGPDEAVISAATATTDGVLAAGVTAAGGVVVWRVQLG
jgi:hypothetical protein